MPKDITHQDFESILGETIELEAGESCFLAKVDSVELLRKNPDQERQPFSVELLADVADNHAQQVYSLSHPALGELSLFVVPLGPEKDGMLYQVVFN
jgi:hypothetical protein